MGFAKQMTMEPNKQEFTILGVRLRQSISSLDHLRPQVDMIEDVVRGILVSWNWATGRSNPHHPHWIHFVDGQVAKISGELLTYDGRAFTQSSAKEMLLKHVPGLFEREDNEGYLDLFTSDFRLNTLCRDGRSLYNMADRALESRWSTVFVNAKNPDHPNL